MVKKRTKKTILIVLGGGGHTEQLLRLVNKLGSRYNYEYVISKEDRISVNKIKMKGVVFKILNPRKMSDKSYLITFLKFIPSSFQALRILMKTKASAIISCGPALSIHLSILGKLIFRKKIIFLESWSRVYSKSLAGKFIYPFADLFFVQWKQQKKNYKNAIYAGRLG